MTHRLYLTPEKIASRLALIRPLIHRRREPIPPFRFCTLPGPQAPAPLAPDHDDGDWDIIAPDSYWGSWNMDFVLRSTFRVPPDWNDRPVALHLPLGEAGDIFTHPEALLHIDGRAYASADRYHHEIRLPEEVRDGGEHALALHGWTGLSSWPPDPASRTRLFMRECSVVQIDEPTRTFEALAQMALGVYAELPDGQPARHRILNVLDAAIGALETRDPIASDAFYASVPGALEALRSGLADAGPPMDVDIVAVGHAHIDIAYLWTIGQTRQKTARTFSNVVRLMEDFPDYRFAQSQAQLYRYTEDDHPALFERIRETVAEGRWEVMGGMWVEPDCNLAGPESLVRQLMLGRRYFESRFGDVETPVLWLPDTFGFCWSLPQLMAQSGLRWFVTNKLSWGQYNPMPAQTTWWQGIDGTRVLAHFLTTPRDVQHLPFPATYKADMTAAEVFGSWRDYRQKEGHRTLMMAFGYGDGGGGPTRELIDKARILGDMPGTPRVRMGTIRQFFEGLEEHGTDSLPVWNDELYMEGHRGVLTSQAGIKRHNRKCEVLLHDAEFLQALACTAAGQGRPKATLDRAWELLCLNQFHDILPGTSIPEVFEDSERDYQEIRSLASEALDRALAAIAKTMEPEARVLAINASPFAGHRWGLLEGAADAALTDLATGQAVPTQPVEGGTLVELPPLPAYSVIGLGAGSDSAEPDTSVAATASDGGIVLENEVLRIAFGPDGLIAGIHDKELQRDVLQPGATGNQLQAFEDRPLNWDAWDIDAFFEDRGETLAGLERMEIIESGPLRAAVLLDRRYRSSRIRQEVRLHRTCKRIDFETTIDWHESHILLKAAFPVAILNPVATYDIQWGSIERPTHRNTSWDFAKFEVPAQKWADLSEGDYGVAILNDCKYGHDIRDGTLRLSLVKSATMPDPAADQGVHRVLYSLLPHGGDWRNGVPQHAYHLNDPVLLHPISGGAGRARGHALVSTDRRNAVIETVKWAEDGDGLIVRLYEGERSRGPVTIRFGFDLRSAERCNLLEEPGEALAIDGDRLTVSLKPFEIVTLRCRPR